MHFLVGQRADVRLTGFCDCDLAIWHMVEECMWTGMLMLQGRTCRFPTAALLAQAEVIKMFQNVYKLRDCPFPV